MNGVETISTNKYSFFLHKEKLLRQRIYAFSIDLFAILSLNKVLTLTYMAYLEQFAWPMYRTLSDGEHLIQEAEILTLLILYSSYFLASLYLSQGKTLGKTLIGLRVVGDESLGQISIKQCFMRSLGYTLCYMGGLLLFALPFLNRKNKGVPDWLSHTHVISEKQWQQLILFHHHQQQSQQKKDRAKEINISGQSPEDDEQKMA